MHSCSPKKAIVNGPTKDKNKLNIKKIRLESRVKITREIKKIRDTSVGKTDEERYEVNVAIEAFCRLVVELYSKLYQEKKEK
jgi:hypothetical protein